jgi:hypothetical protein
VQAAANTRQAGKNDPRVSERLVNGPRCMLRHRIRQSAIS